MVGIDFLPRIILKGTQIPKLSENEKNKSLKISASK